MRRFPKVAVVLALGGFMALALSSWVAAIVYTGSTTRYLSVGGAGAYCYGNYYYMTADDPSGAGPRSAFSGDMQISTGGNIYATGTVTIYVAAHSLTVRKSVTVSPGQSQGSVHVYTSGWVDGLGYPCHWHGWMKWELSTYNRQTGASGYTSYTWSF